MKSYNKCKGCGLSLQSDDINAPCYTPNLGFSICKKCFRAKNYGEVENDLKQITDIKILKTLKDKNVLLIIDVTNPFETMLSNINEYVSASNLTILINKVDLLPKSITEESILEWIDDLSLEKGISFKHASLISAYNNKNIDAIANFILANDNDTAIIGYSNVGKSSVIKSLFKSKKMDTESLITNSIGTTKDVIELKFEDKIIQDYPGLILAGSYQNIMSIDDLKHTNTKKEIKVINYQLNKGQTINIGNYAYFNVKDSIDKKGYQFSFSNLVKLSRSKYLIKEDMILHKLNHTKGIRYDLIISGLGKITFKSDSQTLELQLPKGVKYNLIKSLYK